MAPGRTFDRALSDDNRKLRRIYNRVEKVVVTDSAISLDDNPWRDTTTVVHRVDVADWMAAQRERDAGDILTFGSRTMWNGLLSDALVDELHVMVAPRALGSGMPIFGAPADLVLLDVPRFDGSHNVRLRYSARRWS